MTRTGTPSVGEEQADSPAMNAPERVEADPSPSRVEALLLEVLGNVNREVKTASALTGLALEAVKRFQEIAKDLRTRADAVDPPAPAVAPASKP